MYYPLDKKIDALFESRAYSDELERLYQSLMSSIPENGNSDMKVARQCATKWLEYCKSASRLGITSGLFLGMGYHIPKSSQGEEASRIVALFLHQDRLLSQFRKYYYAITNRGVLVGAWRTKAQGQRDYKVLLDKMSISPEEYQDKVDFSAYMSGGQVRLIGREEMGKCVLFLEGSEEASAKTNMSEWEIIHQACCWRARSRFFESKYEEEGKFTVGEEKRVRFACGNIIITPEGNYAHNYPKYESCGELNEQADELPYDLLSAQQFNAFRMKSDRPWRLLKQEEWHYLLRKRADATKKYAFACVDNLYKGMVILPDKFDLPKRCSFTPGVMNGTKANQYTLQQWLDMDQAGAVFLPFAGYADDVAGKRVVRQHNERGVYWIPKMFEEETIVNRSWEAGWTFTFYEEGDFCNMLFLPAKLTQGNSLRYVVDVE